MKISAVIFDMDGLLINSERIASRVFQETCNRYALGEQFPLYLRLMGTNNATTRLILEETLPAKINKEEFMAFWLETYTEETRKPVPLMTGVIALLDYLESCDIPKAVATSTDTQMALKKLENSGIVHRFKTITGGDQIKHGKPAPDIYFKSAESIGVNPQHCIALEDSPNGVKAALAAQMHTLQIPDLVQPSEELRALGHTVLSDLNAVIDYISRQQPQA